MDMGGKVVHGQKRRHFLRVKRLGIQPDAEIFLEICLICHGQIPEVRTDQLHGIGKNVAADLQHLRQACAVAEDVYRTVSGQQSQRAKLSLETYIQQYYFQEVVAAANLRLTSLSGGVYRLRCKPAVRDLRAQSGLDLDVLDANTGLWRDVSTLSGGESFLASLALALGLSDIVQAMSGGVRLDAMFIDEGFGTLDEAALDQALQLLDKLAGGERLVGIISHVSALKQRIDRKILVEKTATGSSLRLEY